MSNRDSERNEDRADPIEIILYAVFVATSARASVAELADILQVHAETSRCLPHQWTWQGSLRARERESMRGPCPICLTNKLRCFSQKRANVECGHPELPGSMPLTTSILKAVNFLMLILATCIHGDDSDEEPLQNVRAPRHVATSLPAYSCLYTRHFCPDLSLLRPQC